MIGLFTRPLRVYVILGALALWGVLSGLQLPVSLFPNSSQITLQASVSLGSLSTTQFFEAYGRDLESQLQKVRVDESAVKKLTAEYRDQSVRYRLLFDWGAEPEKAIELVQTIMNTRFASASEDVRRSIRVQSWSENSGFFAVSFYSPMRSLDELFQILDPMIMPMASQIEDAGDFGLWNPNRKEVSISLFPEKLAQYEISTQQIQEAIQSAVVGLNGGTFKVGDKDYVINLPKSADSLEMLSQIRVSQRARVPIFLKDIAKITSGLAKSGNQKFKTSGVESLILFSSPKEGGNIKKMSDQILEQMALLEKQWPSDIHYKILVNPSEFIDNSVHSVVREVFMAAFLAVVVLFIFIGSLKNVVTAAIEIPLSLLMAFILMRLAGMNLNLISLGGLALSAGMNVDASVVVLENIFRHFEGKKLEGLSYSDKAQLILKAVNEVKAPIIASTVASLVVFFPLIFTQGLTHSLLGDLAKAVVFSHGLSALVALLLVPTIRLQLLSRGTSLEVHSPFEKTLVRIENFYQKTLKIFLLSPRIQKLTFCSVMGFLAVLLVFVLPHLKKEVIGKPDSDWLTVSVSSPTFSKMPQMESELAAMEDTLNTQMTGEILYTFTQIYSAHDGNIMVRLKDKTKITKLVEKSEDIFKNTPTKFYWVDQWNPSELDIPDPPQMRLEVSGGTPPARLQMAQDVQALLTENGTYDKVRVTPTAEKEKEIRVLPFLNSGSESEVLGKYDLSHYLRVATDGVYVERIFQKQQELPIYLRMSGSDDLGSLDQLKALPIGFEGRLIPLGALAQLNLETRTPRIYQENQKAMILLEGRLNKSQLGGAKTKQLEARKLLQEFRDKQKKNDPDQPTLIEAQADKDLQESLQQLKWAVGISIFLVFLTMVLQIGDIVHALLVLVAIPLGFIGVMVSLFVFQSSLSLNSGLGTILLNGIAVANSIILVDFIKKLHERGKSAQEATLEASVVRLRPILMTSMTTVLGMLPIALGLGEGGKILQPLGIAVCGGLWVSMLLTLYIVPALQYLYLSRNEKKR